jgi:hypothetical protein
LKFLNCDKQGGGDKDRRISTDEDTDDESQREMLGSLGTEEIEDEEGQDSGHGSIY